MAPNTNPSLVKPDSGVVQMIREMDSPSASQHMILAAHHTHKAAARAKAATIAAGGSRPGTYASGRSEAASRLAISGFTNFDSDTRMSGMEPAQRERLEKAMRHTEQQWRQQQQERGALPRTKELLAAQREHLLAALEIDHELRGIWLAQNPESG
ncbi:hypothetical protein K4K49_009023 [Colletotrichum sp. SAR 10_70]|nr:hypothetical protein K4K50_009085 [Colletotrichum sp. SAR 10_71]KAI8156022.1 hypothetical protein K4K49_009023 [Colletotrichum sp. SAR 10_70]KAI8217285.1 hypothetical protein K4K53_009334 [Colletotrichum sp. SAR 10_77]